VTRPDRLETADDAVLLRMARRSSAAFRIVYDRHVRSIHAFFLRRTGDPVAAFELTAETFAQAWLSRGSFTDRGDGAAPWLFGIARNVLASSVRQRAIERRARALVDLDLEAADVPADDAWLLGIDADLAAALAELPDGQRRAVELRVLGDRGYAETAAELGCSEGAARVRVHRGLDALRRLLARASGQPPGLVPTLQQTTGETEGRTR
jgi:RNA polymerase sigma factor (sigma-70 family)